MTPEELAAYREWLRIMEFKDNAWPCMALTHIDQQAARIAELEAQVAALKKIAVEERSNFLYIYFHRSIVAKPLEPIECSNARLQDARRQLAEEHPEAFR